MPRLIKRVSKTKGLPPGALVHIGKRKSGNVRITKISYNEKVASFKNPKTIDECFPIRTDSKVTWINVDGLHDIPVFEKIREVLKIHPLVLEDIMNTDQRPKLEDLEKYIHVVLKMLSYDETKAEVLVEQVSFILGKNFVLSFQEHEGDVFDPVRERLRSGKGSVRKKGADFLLYSLIDTVVDTYFGILEKIGENIEVLEEELIENPAPETLHKIYKQKREMIIIRKSIWPLRETINSFEKKECALIDPGIKPYFRDLYDHTIQIIDTVETFRDITSGLLDVYLSSISNRMNEVMKVLTIISTIFIPLTLISGIYGMNFRYMPELGWAGGYPAVLLLMGVITLFQIAFFKRKGWL